MHVMINQDKCIVIYYDHECGDLYDKNFECKNDAITWLEENNFKAYLISFKYTGMGDWDFDVDPHT